MKILFNLGLAWVAVILAFLLSVVYVTRKISRGGTELSNAFGAINKGLRKHHKAMGIVLVLVGLIHGILSSEKVLSFNIGTISWLVSLLLGVNYMIRKRLSKYKGWMCYHRALTVVFIGTIILHIIDVGGIRAPEIFVDYFTNGGANYSLDQGSVYKIASGFSGVTLKDGVYEGEATGFRPGLKVSVTVSNNKVTDIKVTAHNEVNAKFYQRPISLIPQEIIDNQSLDVDTVSGATRTSVGIINAVNNALSNAVTSGTLPQTTTPPQEEENGKNGGRGREGHGFPGDRKPQQGETGGKRF